MIYFTRTHGEEQFKLFLRDLNECHLNLKFTCEPSQNIVTFLYFNLSLKDGAIFTDIHIKPTDGHQFPHYK